MPPTIFDVVVCDRTAVVTTNLKRVDAQARLRAEHPTGCEETWRIENVRLDCEFVGLYRMTFVFDDVTARQ